MQKGKKSTVRFGLDRKKSTEFSQGKLWACFFADEDNP